MVFLIRDKAWKKAAVFAVGFPIIYLANVLRITLIGVIGYYYGENLALDLFHLLGGWILIFGTTIVLLLASEKILKVSIIGRKKQVCEECRKMPASVKFCQSCGRVLNLDAVKLKRKDLLKVVGIIGVVILLVSIQTPVFALTQGPPEIMLQSPKGGSEATSILPAIANYSLRFVYRDKGFENVSGQDASVVYAYFPEYPYNETEESIWVAIEVASDISSLHRWETCLINWPILQGHQPRVIQVELNDTQITDNPPMIGRFFIFNRTANYELQAVLYWYESAVFTINGTALQKQVKISVEAYPATLDDIPKIKSQLLEFAIKIAGYWQPLKAWSQWSLFLSQKGDIFAILALGMTALIVGIQFYGTRTEKKRSTVAFKKLSDLDKLIVNSIHSVKKPDSSTLIKILANYIDGKGTVVDKETLLDRLTALEKLGVVKTGIASSADEPLHVWKANVSLRNP
jgi:exosortase/archaeosortase family protein